MPTDINGQRPARTVDLGAGVKAWLPTYTTHEDGDVVIECEIDLVDGRLACTRLRAVRGALTGDVLRRLPMAEEVARKGASFAFTMAPPEDYPATGPTPSALRYVAQVYRLAYVTGRPPVKAVEDTGLSRPTAGRWIARARAEGLLDPAEGPGKAGG